MKGREIIVMLQGLFFVCSFLFFSFGKNWLGGHLENSEKTVSEKRGNNIQGEKLKGWKSDYKAVWSQHEKI